MSRINNTANPAISFRTTPKGGPVRRELTPGELELLKQTTHPVLLIHGYNNNQAEANASYTGFDARQRELAELDDSQPIANGRIIEVYWPGDADWGVLSPLYYMDSIERARETARALADTLQQVANEHGAKYIDIVAHSMGCRLSFELLRCLQNIPGVTIGRIVFMAGAVPVNRLTHRGDKLQLRQGYDNKLVDAALSLYSPDDKVLRFAFPAGQLLAGVGEGFLPTALGHEQWIDVSSPVNLSQQQNNGAGHSDYWGKELDTLEESRFANRQIHDFLQFEQIGARTTVARATPSRHTPAPRITLNEPDFESIWF